MHDVVEQVEGRPSSSCSPTCGRAGRPWASPGSAAGRGSRPWSPTTWPFRPTADAELPAAPAYLLVDPDTGRRWLDVPPEQVLPPLLASGRSPLTLDEGLALLLQDGGVLRRDTCFSMLAAALRRPSGACPVGQQGPATARLVLGRCAAHLARLGVRGRPPRLTRGCGMLSGVLPENFDELVLDVIARIPPRHVMSYGDVADYLGVGGPAPGRPGAVERHRRPALVAGAAGRRFPGAADRRRVPRTPPRRGDPATADGTRVDMRRARWDGR